MKAMVLKEYHRAMEITEMETPRIRDDEILLEVKACGVCQTDLKIFRGEIPPPIVTLPHVPGHEVAGEVVAVGDKVQGIRKGDAGVLYIYIACRQCEWCLSGRENLCPDLKRIGFELPGGYAQYVRVPSYAFCPIDPKIPYEKMAILTDAVATSFRAMSSLAQVKPGQNILIVGAGGLGIHGVQIAKLCGAKVWVADKKESALQLAKQYGADVLIHVDEKNPPRVDERKPQGLILEMTKGSGVDAVVEYVGSPETLAWSLPSLKKGGRLILVGYTPGRPFPLDTMAMHYHEWEVRGARLCTKAELLQVIRLVEQGRISPVVSKTFPFEEANEALNTLQHGEAVGRVVLSFR